MECKLTVEQDGIQLEAVLEIDRSKFTDKLAEDINTFWSGHQERVDNHGSHFNAALKLYGQQFFQRIAFNNFKTASWLRDQFDWNNGHGVEGFASFEVAGITLNYIDTWFIEDTIVELEITEKDGES